MYYIITFEIIYKCI